MWQNARDAYLENRILSADPVELVHLLYQACTTAVGDARRHLAAGEIMARSRSISKACKILLELASSLDHEQGRDYSRRLAQLYGYMHRRLLEANFQQSDEPLADVAGLLETLTEAWEAVRRDAQPASHTATPWMQSIPREAELAHISGGWSF
jgi:flagellar protein FliS